MDKIRISFMELNEIEESAKVLSHAMLENTLHIAVFKGKGENERLKIEQMFHRLFKKNPAVVFLAKEKNKIIGVMRMKSCCGSSKISEPETTDENHINHRKYIWLKNWSQNDPKEQHWHLGPIGVLPRYKGMGIGSKLMERFCNEVDQCNAKAYLETDLDENVIFYKKFGFEIVKRTMILGVESRFMERPSREEN